MLQDAHSNSIFLQLLDKLFYSFFQPEHYSLPSIPKLHSLISYCLKIDSFFLIGGYFSYLAEYLPRYGGFKELTKARKLIILYCFWPEAFISITLRLSFMMGYFISIKDWLIMGVTLSGIG